MLTKEMADVLRRYLVYAEGPTANKFATLFGHPLEPIQAALRSIADGSVRMAIVCDECNGTCRCDDGGKCILCLDGWRVVGE